MTGQARNEVINTKNAIYYCMASPAEEVEEIREKTVREQVDLYRQLKEQLVHEVERYRREGNDRLASIILDSLKE